MSSDFSLYLITDRRQTCGRALTDVVHRALDGGVRAVQLREKDLPSSELYRLAEELRAVTAKFTARLVINDRVDIALAVDADGVHAGAAGMPIPVIRRLLGRDKTLIYSAHTVPEARQAQHEGADYVTFGPVFHTPSKAEYGEPCGPGLLADAVTALQIPVLGLGGISERNAAEVLNTGVGGIAVISAVISAEDPAAAAQNLLKKIEEHARHS